MLNRLFPKQFDNNYRGHWLAILLYVAIVPGRFLMGVNVTGLNPWISNLYVLKTVDGIPFDTFGAEAASVVIHLFTSWGLGVLVFGLLGILVLIRYRAMIPLMFLLLLIEQGGRIGNSMINPIVRAVKTEGISPGVLINWGVTAALAIGLVLSLAAPRGKRTDERDRPA